MSANPRTTSAPHTAITLMNARGPARESTAWFPLTAVRIVRHTPADQPLADDATAMRVEERVEDVAQGDDHQEGPGHRGDHGHGAAA